MQMRSRPMQRLHSRVDLSIHLLREHQRPTGERTGKMTKSRLKSGSSSNRVSWHRRERGRCDEVLRMTFGSTRLTAYVTLPRICHTIGVTARK